MVLHPLTPEPAPSGDGFRPVWQAISQAQLRRREAYWLITQPDHAALAGALAGNFASKEFPQLEPEVVRAIGLHDSGWAIFAAETGAGASPPLDAAGKPLAFFEIAPADFLRAWTASIDRAAQVAPVGGIMVSRHFCWLGRYRLETRSDPPEVAAMLNGFLQREAGRQQRLQVLEARSEAALERLTSTLQFCDLLSLYLCSGAQDAVEFPQKLASRAISLRWRDGACVLDPSPFAAGVSLGVTARRYPGAPDTTTLGFLLW
jgi:hypothetical protein